MYIIGVDPGKQGAVVLIDEQLIIHNYGIFKPQHDLSFIARELDKFLCSIPEVDTIYFEDVHSIFGASAKSNFSFGKGVGTQLSVCSLHTSNIIEVQPKKWQQRVITADDLGNTTKERALSAAKRLFPGESFIPKGCRTPHDGLVDAVLIAYYGLLNEKF